MPKTNTIAIIFGGNSPEYSVSLQSAYSVLTNINHKKYNIIPIGISKDGKWFRYYGSYDNIKNDTWLALDKNVNPITINFNNDNNIFIETNKNNQNQSIEVNAVFPILHGKNGEDGTVQAIFTLANIPIIGCDFSSSAICMDKHKSHILVKNAGINVPHGITVKKNLSYQSIINLTNQLKYPIFIKPLKAGSSYGITKVLDDSMLRKAVNLAFEYDDTIIIEESIDGFEVGCAVLGNNDLMVGQVDEIELQDGFFDYNEKYTLKSSKIHMPARIDADLTNSIRKTAVTIYNTLDCKGFARIDMFITKNNDIIFNEVNTIPGFTNCSRYPNMMKGIMSFSEIIQKLIDVTL